MKPLYFLILFLFCVLNLQAQTSVSGTYSTDTRWGIAGSPYTLTGDLIVEEGVTLSIEPGVEVLLPNDNRNIRINGTLKAIGQVSDSIRFYGNNPSPSEYGGALIFSSSSTDNELEYVKLERMGSGSPYTPIYVDNAQISMKHSTIINPRTDYYFRVSHQTPSLLTFENNDIPYVSVDGGEIETDATWKLPDVSYSMLGDLTVNEGITLTLPPGMEIMWINRSRKFFINGTLKAKGEVGDSIRFYGNNPSPSEYGGALIFSSSSTDNELEYVKLERMGNDSPYAPIYADSAQIRMKHSMIINPRSNIYFRVTPQTPPLLTFENNDIPYVTVDGGEIEMDATWKLPDVSYSMIGDLTINEGVTLTLPPGMDIWLSDDRRDIFINGTLKAKGEVGDSIRFYGNNPSSFQYGGTLVFSSTSTDNELEYVKLERIGDASNNYDAPIYADSATIIMKHSRIFNSGSSNFFRVTARTPPLLTFDNNDIPTVSVNTGIISENATWQLPDVSYSMLGNLTIAENTTLTLSPSIELWFPGRNRGLGVHGTLIANGNSDNKIKISGKNPDGSDQFGGSIAFFPSSSGSLLNQVEIHKMGDHSSLYCAVYIDQAEVTISNSKIFDFWYANSYMRVTTQSPPFLEFDNNDIPTVLVEGGTIIEDATWKLPDVSYSMLGNLTIAENTILTLPPSIELWFPRRNRGLGVHGTLIANGNSDNKIKFLGKNPDGSDQFGGSIAFFPSSSGSLLNQVEVHKMGDHSSLYGAVYIDQAEVTISNSKIFDFWYADSYMRVTTQSPPLLTFDNNDIPTVLVEGDTIKKDAKWAIPDNSYTLLDHLIIPEDITLTLQPGTEIHFPQYKRNMYVHGKLLAQGTPSNRIRFSGTGEGNDRRYFYGGGIYFSPTSEGSIVRYSDFDFMGYPDFGAFQRGVIVSRSPDLLIQDNSFETCLYSGIIVDDFSPVIKDNCFESIVRNAGVAYGVFATANANSPINATNNYWGSASGPYNQFSNPNGNQDIQINDNVTAIPFLTGCGDESGLIAYYDFDDNVIDQSPFENDGTIVGTPEFAPGVFDEALDFNGDGDYVSVNNSFQLNDSFSVSVWINVNEIDTEWQTIFSKFASNTGPFWFGLHYNKLNIWISDGAGGNLNFDSERTLEPNTWYHIIFSGKDDVGKIYVNCVLDPTMGSIPLMTQNNDLVAIGRQDLYLPQYDSYADFGGKMDELKVYDRILSDDEINLLCANPIQKDLTIHEVDSPISGCNLTTQEQVSVQILNIGSQTQTSFDVSLSIDGTIRQTQTVNTNLESGEIYTHTFSNSVDLSNIDTYDFEIDVNLSGDEVTSNDTKTFTIEHYPDFEAEVTDNPTICQGESITLRAMNGTDFEWSTGSTFSTTTVSPDQNTTYSVTVTNAVGCTDVATVTVSVLPPPAIPAIAASSNVLCTGSTVTLSVDRNLDNVIWSTGETTNSIVVSQGDRNYTVSVIGDNGCSSSSDYFVDQINAPILSVPNNGNICEGESVQLSVFTDPFSSSDILWSTGETTSIITDTPINNTTYSVTVTSSGCVYTDSATVIVRPDLPAGAVNNMRPLDGQIGLSLPINFTWSPGDDAGYYELFIGADANSLQSVGTTSNINISYANLNFGKSYCWQVVSYSFCGTKGEEGPIQCFTLSELPDLIVENIQVPTTTPTAGAPIEITWTTKNIGLQSTPDADWQEAIYLSKDNQIGNDDLIGYVSATTVLGKDDEVSNSKMFNLSDCETGEYYIIIRTDRASNQQEANEQNNITISDNPFIVQSASLPDLVVKGTPIINVAGIAQAGESYSVIWDIENQGSADAKSGFWTRISIDTSTFYNPATAIALRDTFIDNKLELGEVIENLNVEVTLPQNLSDGSHYLYIVVDFNNFVQECNFDGNNVSRSDVFNVLEIPQPDFIVTAVDAIANTASNKEFVSVHYDITNLGVAFTGYLADRIYLNDTPDLVSPISRTSKGGNEAIGSQETVSRVADFQIPNNITGKYYLLVETNTSNNISENDKTNNVSPFAIIDSIEVISPNLSPNSLTTTSNVAQGEVFNATWNIQNTGPGDFLNNYLGDKFYLSPNQDTDLSDDISFFNWAEGSNTTILLNGNQSRSKNFTIPNGTPIGNYYPVIVTNSNNTAYENGMTSDNKYVSSTTINVSSGQYPDLNAEDIAADTTKATAGDFIDLTFMVNNNTGDVPAIGNWEDKIYLCSCSQWNQAAAIEVKSIAHSQALPVGESYSKNVRIQLPYSLSGGSHFFYLKTDADENIIEINNSNLSNIIRSSSIDIDTYESIDLKIQNVTPPSEIIPEQPATVYFETKNSGSSDTYSGGWYDGIVLSENTIWEPSVDTANIIAQWLHTGNLVRNQQYSGLKNFTLPNNLSGSYYVLLVTDLYNSNGENDTSNNAFILPQTRNSGNTDPVVFPDKPDLIIDITNAPATAIAGQPISIQYTVTNQNVEAIGNWIDRAYLATSTVINSNAISLGQIAASKTPLAQDETYSGILEVFLPTDAAGNYFLILDTDGNNRLNEDNENNNTDALPIFVEEPLPADLGVTNITAVPLDTITTMMTVNWQLENLGTNPVEGRLFQNVYLSEDEVWDASDILFGSQPDFVELTPMQKANFSLTARLEGLKRQDYFVIIQTDVQNNIPETNEDNNRSISSTTTFIEIPEIIVDEPAVAAQMQKPLPIFYRIEISGNLIGQSVRVSLDSDDNAAFNELYVSFSEMPNRTVYDFGFDMPFSPNQSILIPETKEGTYYVMAYPVEDSGTQNVELKAEIVPFEITEVQSNRGGNTGQVTVKISGGKFKSDMEIWLDDNNGTTYYAENIFYINAAEAYVSFNLSDAALGVYDVKGMLTAGDSANLTNGFTIEGGTITNSPLTADCSFGSSSPLVVLNVGDDLSTLKLEKIHPQLARPGQTIEITLRYTNTGNIDVPIPQRILESQGYPVSLDQLDFSGGLESINLNFPYESGNQSFPFIPPGGTVTRKIHAKAMGSNGDVIKIKILSL